MSTIISKRESGVSLVEFALVMPVLALILMGIFDLGRAVYYSNAMSEGAREAARQAISCFGGASTIDCSSNDSATKTFVVNNAPGVPWTTSNVSISPSSRKFGDTVTVTTNVDYVPITPLIARIIGNGVTLHLTAQSNMLAK